MNQKSTMWAREECRVCGHRDLADIISLGSLYVSNFVDGPETMDNEEKYPLDLVLCNAEDGGCGLLQLRHTVSPEKMYRNYWYRSGINQTMIDDLTELARTAEGIPFLKENDIVLDIGSNDGTLLRAYTTPEITRVGFEPSQNFLDLGQEGADSIINDFFSREPFHREFGDRKAKIITAIAMFYDLDKPNDFVGDVAALLDPEGVFIIQMSYLPLMLSQNAFDNICHEHIQYYSLLSLEKLLERHGLEVFDVELNDVNGGSYRTYIRHVGSAALRDRPGAGRRVRNLRRSEDTLKLNSKTPYTEFASRVGSTKDKLVDFIKRETASGKKVHAYGASTKGNTLLQYFSLDKTLVEAVADRNPIKWGKKTIGTNIPIVSEDESRKASPDYYLALPWHFLSEFLEREKKFLERGGKFIVPLPEFRLIGKDEPKRGADIGVTLRRMVSGLDSAQ